VIITLKQQTTEGRVETLERVFARYWKERNGAVTANLNDCVSWVYRHYDSPDTDDYLDIIRVATGLRLIDVWCVAHPYQVVKLSGRADPIWLTGYEYFDIPRLIARKNKT